jgi:hypothetical protein
MLSPTKTGTIVCAGKCLQQVCEDQDEEEEEEETNPSEDIYHD